MLVTHAGGAGIFSGHITSPLTKGYLRARTVSPAARSLPFSLVSPPDRFIRPFGCGVCP
jgi:hypothetical protein